MLLFLIGYMGCGKSSIGRPLAKRLGLKFVDMDTEIERRCGVSVQQFFADRGEEAFRRLERELLRELTSAEDTVVATGGGVPCFFDNMELMNGAGVTVYFKLAPEKLAARLEHGKAKRPLLRGKSQQELVEYIRENLERREPFYSRARLIVACDSMSDEYVARHVEMYMENSYETCYDRFDTLHAGCMRKIAAGDLSCLEDRLAGAYERQYAADSYGLSGADGYGSRGRLDQPDGDGSDPFFVR